MRKRLIVTAAAAAVYLGLTVTMLVLRIWPAAVLFAVFAVGWSTRVVLMLRRFEVRRYATTLLAVQLTCWLLAAAYYLITRYWLGLFVAVILAGTAFGYSRLAKSRPIDA
ncbi:hypothetical protein ACIA49_08325 [Kribbella sp. NPDC051587]|uniref:hypothetical protein n=1 Tax=Kribbella sp. NPDC051587 TaxID=3364119 RepID=UPI0037873795